MNSVFSIYRDGQSEESTLNIGKEEVLKAVNNYDNYKDIIKQIKTLQFLNSNFFFFFLCGKFGVKY